jgi:hypothetical protein
MIIHPFMPPTKDFQLDEIMKRMNDIHTKMKYVRNPAILHQMKMILTGYQDEYQKRMSQSQDKTKTKTKTGNNDE